MGKFYGELGDELSLYVRHLAWLSAVPQPKKKKRLQDSDEDPQLSRIQKLHADDVEPSMPPCRAQYLIKLLMEIGPTESSGGEPAPISWTTIKHFQQSAGFSLSPWQARLIRRLSAEYLVEGRKARDEDRPAPWGVITQDQRAVVDAKLRSVFSGLMARMRRK